jgi:CheY-like chemotaxis protein
MLLKKIIIVEDDIFLQDFYKLFFKKIGANVSIIEDPDELVQSLEKEKTDLIIMDINLRNSMLGNKKIDGLKLSRFIKLNFGHLHIPILLITAYALSSFGDNVFEDSLADDYMIKPISDYNKLIEKINKLVYVHDER